MSSYPVSANTPTMEHQQLTQQYQQYQANQQLYSVQQQQQSSSSSGMTESSRRGINQDSPPFSRVFVVCSKSMKEEEIQESFSTYGTIDDVWMVKDRMTKENKGICYVKFDKASSAAAAIENLDNKVIGSDPKPIKVSKYMPTLSFFKLFPSRS